MDLPVLNERPEAIGRRKGDVESTPLRSNCKSQYGPDVSQTAECYKEELGQPGLQKQIDTKTSRTLSTRVNGRLNQIASGDRSWTFPSEF